MTSSRTFFHLPQCASFAATCFPLKFRERYLENESRNELLRCWLETMAAFLAFLFVDFNDPSFSGPLDVPASFEAPTGDQPGCPSAVCP